MKHSPGEWNALIYCLLQKEMIKAKSASKIESFCTYSRLKYLWPDRNFKNGRFHYLYFEFASFISLCDETLRKFSPPKTQIERISLSRSKFFSLWVVPDWKGRQKLEIIELLPLKMFAFTLWYLYLSVFCLFFSHRVHTEIRTQNSRTFPGLFKEFFPGFIFQRQ